MKSPEVRYNTDQKNLQDLLLSVDRAGDFCIQGRIFAPTPVLEVENVGVVAFPVQAAQVTSLIAQAVRAPYGKGADTILDTSVRDCWQIGTDHVCIGGVGWKDTFAKICTHAAEGLGCDPNRIDATFYKMLIYEVGGFFQPHRDSEKEDGMIATLSISLPVAGAGGELVITHRQREVIADVSATEPSELAFVAFYADCLHETRPVRDGHRIVLVFNLCVKPDDKETPRTAADHLQTTGRATHLLSAWRESAVNTEKLVWVLEHEYSEGGLAFNTLKGADAAVARMLESATEQSDCVLYAAVVHVEEYGLGELEYHDSTGWGGSQEDDEWTIIEVDEACHWLDSWVSPDGSKPDIGKLPLRASELLPVGALDDAEPDEHWVHEASGNEGVSIERAYRRAVLVLWPRETTITVLAAGNFGAALAWVAAESQRLGAAWGSAQFARLLDYWAGVAHESSGQLPPEFNYEDRISRRDIVENLSDMLQFVTVLGDIPLALRTLQLASREKFEGSESAAYVSALRLIGPNRTAQFLPPFAEAHFPDKPADVVRLVESLDRDTCGDSASNPDWQSALTQTVHTCLQTLPVTLGARASGKATDNPRGGSRTDGLQGGLIHGLLRLAWCHGLHEEAETAVDALLEAPDVVSPDRALPAALKKLRVSSGLRRSSMYAKLWRGATQFLLMRSASAPTPPTDWRIGAEIDCSCGDCRILAAFCRDPETRTLRLPRRKDLRSHLHQVIDRNRLDITHATERKGSPYTLVCTKNHATYERRLDEYASDMKQMHSLAEGAPDGECAAGCASLAEELHKAIAAAGQEVAASAHPPRQKEL